MTAPTVKVDFFFAGGCDRCAEARDALRETAQSSGEVRWQEIDIAKEPNRAVDAGIVSTPAVAIDGQLAFRRMPSAIELRKAIRARIAKA